MFGFIAAIQSWLSMNRVCECKQKSIISVVLAGDLVLKVSEEASLGLLPLTMLIDDPFLIFEELSVLDEGFVDIGLAMSTSSAVSVSVSFDSDSSVGMSTSVDVRFSVGVSSVG